MKNSLLILLGLIACSVRADNSLTVFTAGDTIKADEMNTNFSIIKSDIDDAKEAIEVLNAESLTLNQLQSELAAAKAQVNTLQSVINNNASSEDESIEFVGFSDSFIFGNLGLTQANSVCPNKYPGAEICSSQDLEGVDDWGALDGVNGTQVFIASVNNGQEMPCSQFASLRDEGTTLGYVSNGRFFIREIKERASNNRGGSCVTAVKGTVGQWVSANTGRHPYSSQSAGAICDQENVSYDSGGTDGVYFSVCAINIPAACCK